MEFSPEAWAGRSSWHAHLRDRGYGAKRDGHAGAGVHFELITHYGFNDGYSGDTAVTRAPVGAIEPRNYDGSYLYASWSSEAGAFERSKCIASKDWDTGARVTRAAEYNWYTLRRPEVLSYNRASVSGCTV